MIRELMSSRRFAPLFWAQFFSALNDNVLKNALVIILLYSAATGHGDALVTVAGAVFIFPYFILSGLGGYDATYGSLAGVMIALIFFFIIGLGLVIGAELNAALAETPRPNREDVEAAVHEEAAHVAEQKAVAKATGGTEKETE